MRKIILLFITLSLFSCVNKNIKNKEEKSDIPISNNEQNIEESKEYLHAKDLIISGKYDDFEEFLEIWDDWDYKDRDGMTLTYFAFSNKKYEWAGIYMLENGANPFLPGKDNIYILTKLILEKNRDTTQWYINHYDPFNDSRGEFKNELIKQIRLYITYLNRVEYYHFIDSLKIDDFGVSQLHKYFSTMGFFWVVEPFMKDRGTTLIKKEDSVTIINDNKAVRLIKSIRKISIGTDFYMKVVFDSYSPGMGFEVYIGKDDILLLDFSHKRIFKDQEDYTTYSMAGYKEPVGRRAEFILLRQGDILELSCNGEPLQRYLLNETFADAHLHLRLGSNSKFTINDFYYEEG